MKQSWKIFWIIGITLGILGTHTPAKAETGMKIVFFNSVWGSAIGAVSGLAYWGIKDEETDKISRYILRGAALGTFAGMAYGFYEVNREDSVFSQTPPKRPQGLFHYASQDSMWWLIPENTLHVTQVDEGTLKLQTTFISADF